MLTRLRPSRLRKASYQGTEGPGANESLDRLQAILGDDRLDRLLVDYSIGRHNREMAVDLVRLVSGTLPEFRDWLSTMARSARRPEGPQPEDGLSRPPVPVAAEAEAEGQAGKIAP